MTMTILLNTNNNYYSLNFSLFKKCANKIASKQPNWSNGATAL